MEITWDIETIPGQNDRVKQYIDDLKPPGTHKKEITIAEWRHQKWLSTALDPNYGEIICIGVKCDAGDIRVFCRDSYKDTKEADIIKGFYDYLYEIGVWKWDFAQWRWIGFNIRQFDFPFLYKRSLSLGVIPSFPLPNFYKSFNPRIIDLMEMWAGRNFKGNSLKNVCEILNIECKTEMDGADVWPTVEAGNIQKLIEYNKEDVMVARKLYENLNRISLF